MKNFKDLNDKHDRNIHFLFLIIFFICCLLLATPGYYSNDELIFLSPTHTMDKPAVYGLKCIQLAFNADCMMHARFFRPLGGFILAKIMRGNDFPFTPHLLMVALHGCNSVLAYILFRQKSQKSAFLIAILFAASPLALYTVGWVAAIYDVLATFCGLVLALCLVRYVDSGSRISLAAIPLFTLLALLSKETAFVIPAVALLSFGLSEYKRFPRRSLIAFAAVIVVWLIYLALRFNALTNAAATSPGGYQAKLGFNVTQNLMAYAEFPFAYKLAEIANVNLLSAISAALCIAAFLLIFIFSWISSGFMKAGASFALWLTPLLPVLVIVKFETQYLYASAIGLSMALAPCLLSTRKWIVVATALLVAILCLHAFVIERSMYETGICQTALINDLRFYRNYSQQSRSVWPPKITTASDAPNWVLQRLVSKWDYWNTFEPPVIVGSGATFDLSMTPTCHLQPAMLK